MSRSPTISVIMANYNGATYLADAIQSVKRQSWCDLELIVSDDGSTDESVDIVHRAMGEDPRIRLIRSSCNSGPAAARNRAIAVATGEWIAVVDGDDLMEPNRLALLLRYAEQDNVDIVADGLLQFSAAVGMPLRPLLFGRWAKSPFWVDIIDFIFLNRFYGAGPALGYLKPVFKASILKSLDPCYNETLRIAEDYDLVFRLLYSGNKMRIYPSPLYLYRKHADSISHRLSEHALGCIRAVELGFLKEASAARDCRLAFAIQARLDSIDTALAFERLLRAIKSGSWSAATRIVLDRPQAAMLLRLPIGVRLRKLVPLRI